jgi:signal peptidase I
MRLKQTIAILFWATTAALGFRFFLLEDYRVFSDSMSPALLSGDLVFVTKATYNVKLPFSSYEILKLRRPARGEVVVFSLPDHGSETYIKRVVGLEGDEIAIRGGTLEVNGKPLSYEAQAPASGHLKWEKHEKGGPYPVVSDSAQIADYGPVQIPQGHFFVLGDNRGQSVDSRSWGPIPFSCLKGKVSLIWFSNGPSGIRPERIGRWVRS